MTFLMRQASVFVSMAGAAGLVYGQSDAALSDPTRPPQAIVEPVTTASPESAAPPSGLQTVILGKGHKPRAVINGVMVELGGKVGDATLVRLNETEAVLQGPAGREILYLTPGVEKTDSVRQKPRIGVEPRESRATEAPRPRPMSAH